MTQPVLERELVSECRAIAHAMNACLMEVGQRRAKGSGTTVGFPDLVLVCAGRRSQLIEVKRPQTAGASAGLRLARAAGCDRALRRTGRDRARAALRRAVRRAREQLSARPSFLTRCEERHRGPRAARRRRFLDPPASAAAATCGGGASRTRRPGTRLCDPCDMLVASCRPFAGAASETPSLTGPAPPDVNLLELVAGIMLTHDALHPGEPLYLREALAAFGVEADHVLVWQIAGKLKRRHGLVLSGESRQAGYRVEDWKWEARRVRSSLGGR